MPIEIGPDGSPIVTSEGGGTSASFTPTTDAPTTEGDSTQAPQTNEAQIAEAPQTTEGPMEVEMLPPPEIPKHLLSKKALREAVLEIASRHCSDSVSREKCASEVVALFPDW